MAAVILQQNHCLHWSQQWAHLGTQLVTPPPLSATWRYLKVPLLRQDNQLNLHHGSTNCTAVCGINWYKHKETICRGFWKMHQSCYTMQQASPYLTAICQSQTKTNISDKIRQLIGEPRYCRVLPVTFSHSRLNSSSPVCLPAEGLGPSTPVRGLSSDTPNTPYPNLAKWVPTVPKLK